MSTDLSQKIFQLRKQQGLTLEQVANVVGVGKSTVRKWETGMIANMKRDKIALLAKALNTTPGYLMGWEDQTKLLPPNPLTPPINEEEVTVIEAYRAQPELQTAVKRVLGLEDITMYIAAQTKPNNKYTREKLENTSKELSEKLYNAPADETDL